MEIGCNLSNELIKLVKKDIVKIDYGKIAINKLNDSIPNWYKDFGKLLLHGVGNDVKQHSGAIVDENTDWKQINKQINNCDYPFFGIHCATYLSDWNDEKVTYEMTKKRMSKFISDWVNNINAKLLIENVPYNKYYEINKPYIIKHSVNPQMISELCFENNIGLILDLAHAKISASGLNMELKDYLLALPLTLVEEIHVVGINIDDNGNLRDNHLEMQKDDYEILEWILKRTNPKLLTLEYGGFGNHYVNRSNLDAIKRQLTIINEIVDNLNIM